MNVFIENPAGTNIKNIYNEKTFEFIKSRPYSRTTPFAYGFIIGTKSGDGDALDCFVITDQPLKSSQRVACEPLAMLEYFEDDELDHKILMRIEDEQHKLHQPELEQIEDFLLHVFDHLPEKRVRIGKVQGTDKAHKLIESLATP
ncbi:MAG: inorganic diphosphatase [Patescibacteria group bacterium]